MPIRGNTIAMRATESSLRGDPEPQVRVLSGVGEESDVRSTASILSNILLRLDHASVQLDQIDGAIRKGDSAAADAALKDYIQDLTDFCTGLAPLRITTREHGVIGRMLDQLESQLSRLERMKQHVLAGYSASVSEPLAQVKAALRMVQDKVIQGQR